MGLSAISRRQVSARGRPSHDLIAIASTTAGPVSSPMRATKYGSLSTLAGSLNVVWKCTGAGTNDKLELTWMETGGPTVKSPSKPGFGSKLIERGLIHEFDARVKSEFNESGLRCAIEIPLTAEFGHMRMKVSGGGEGGMR
jgi:hypothetical protein